MHVDEWMGLLIHLNDNIRKYIEGDEKEYRNKSDIILTSLKFSSLVLKHCQAARHDYSPSEVMCLLLENEDCEIVIWALEVLSQFVRVVHIVVSLSCCFVFVSLFVCRLLVCIFPILLLCLITNIFSSPLSSPQFLSLPPHCRHTSTERAVSLESYSAQL